MTEAGAKYPFTCEICGTTGYFNAAYKYRHRPLLCLGCIREKNGFPRA